MLPPSYALSHDAAALFRRLAEGASLRPLDAEEHGPAPEADAVLASLLDLNSTVRLADHLATHRRSPLPEMETSASPLRERLSKKVDDLRTEAASTFDQPFTGRRAFPQAQVVLRVLTETSALETRGRAECTEAARTLQAQVRERFDHQLAKARQRIRWLRTDAASEIRAFGPRAADLETFDSVLARALEAGFHRLHRSLEVRLDDVFVARIVTAVAALPEGATSLDAWYAPRGVLTRHAEDLGALLRLLVDYELDALLALVDTAYALRSQGPHA